MTRILKQSTAVDVRIGPFVDVGDGFTPETGITLGAADEAEALRAGTATLDISALTWAAVTGADGWYTLSLSTTATNTVGELIIVVQDDSVCLPVWNSFYVVEEAVYDAFFAASAGMAVTLASGAVTAAVIATGAIDADAIADNAIDAGAIASGAITSAKFAAGAIDATAIANGAIDAATFATGAIDAAALAADAGTEIGTAVWASATRVLTANTNLNDPTAAAIADAVWDEAQADHVGVGTFGVTASEIADILVDTAEIGAAGAGLTAINLPDQTMSITGDITGNLSGSVGSVTGAVGSVTGNVGGNVTGSVGSVAAGGITAASIATGAIDADALAADAGTELADAFLNRDMSTGTDSGSTTVRTVRQALRLNRNKVAIAAGTMTVYKEDDSTSSWTSVVTTDAAAEPIISSDPAGP